MKKWRNNVALFALLHFFLTLTAAELIIINGQAEFYLESDKAISKINSNSFIINTIASYIYNLCIQYKLLSNGSI